ncbi:hypothetical protein AJ80_09813 [Polytolypa hystricis UAMH7299]|uniref:Uncharacterized protein n=1 Tax=Polytolypa hystricis (strain UAMH7299) TaxID=1447883 RepID=A0A2B7WAI3_POLH7|nr:hypothetical protein AJ80_09813 [Polytolypa hystricis UAMH7299]
MQPSPVCLAAVTASASLWNKLRLLQPGQTSPRPSRHGGVEMTDKTGTSPAGWNSRFVTKCAFARSFDLRADAAPSRLLWACSHPEKATTASIPARSAWCGHPRRPAERCNCAHDRAGCAAGRRSGALKANKRHSPCNSLRHGSCGHGDGNPGPMEPLHDPSAESMAAAEGTSGIGVLHSTGIASLPSPSFSSGHCACDWPEAIMQLAQQNAPQASRQRSSNSPAILQRPSVPLSLRPSRGSGEKQSPGRGRRQGDGTRNAIGRAENRVSQVRPGGQGSQRDQREKRRSLHGRRWPERRAARRAAMPERAQRDRGERAPGRMGTALDQFRRRGRDPARMRQGGRPIRPRARRRIFY